MEDSIMFQPGDEGRGVPTEQSTGQEGVETPVSGVSGSLQRPDDLREALSTAYLVNEHLNSEIEKITKALEEVKAENKSWQIHCRNLARKLVSERKNGIGGEGVSEDAVDSLSQLPAVQEPLSEATEFWGDGNLPEYLNKVQAAGRAEGWLLQPHEVMTGEILGKGTFGTTYQGQWRGGDCAVKRLTIRSRTEAENFIREVEVLAHLRHPNVMPFYGCCLSPPSNCWLVCEYMSGGNLADWLYGKGRARHYKSRRPLVDRLRMGLQVAQGMVALESTDPPILHRDLKPSNIFISPGGAAAVGDFGLARLMGAGCAATLTGETGTYMYMAPEVVNHESYTTSADVYSWGVLLAELLKGELPYEGMYLAPVQIALAVGQGDLRPPIPPKAHAGVSQIASACFNEDPGMRPTFAYVCAALGPIVDRMQEEADAAASAPSTPGMLMSSVEGLFRGGWRQKAADAVKGSPLGKTLGERR